MLIWSLILLFSPLIFLSQPVAACIDHIICQAEDSQEPWDLPCGFLPCINLVKLRNSLAVEKYLLTDMALAGELNVSCWYFSTLLSFFWERSWWVSRESNWAANKSDSSAWGAVRWMDVCSALFTRTDACCYKVMCKTGLGDKTTSALTFKPSFPGAPGGPC